MVKHDEDVLASMHIIATIDKSPPPVIDDALRHIQWFRQVRTHPAIKISSLPSPSSATRIPIERHCIGFPIALISGDGSRGRFQALAKAGHFWSGSLGRWLRKLAVIAKGQCRGIYGMPTLHYGRKLESISLSIDRIPDQSLVSLLRPRSVLQRVGGCG
jgi:hypothetical protein